MDSAVYSLIALNSRHHMQLTKPSPEAKGEVLGTRLINPLCVTLGLASVFGLVLAQDWGYCLNDLYSLLYTLIT